ncbi:nuclear transport factor 2 family protein [Dyella sp. AtDHG13]|uniref:nuclear transport factor 2 family protein n=1 Tax=Dyella sp. AtDHG13 TaxID=1938897 RepID=UPI001314E2AE|nr:nuclear transport factor 2 family protein [Dyella sp. AtDHG13]
MLFRRNDFKHGRPPRPPRMLGLAHGETAMRARWLTNGLFAFGASVALSCAYAKEAPVPVRDELVRITQVLMDALPSGDKAAWEKWAADDAVTIDEFGWVAGKAETIASLRPFPAGISGSIEMRDPHAWLYGDTALLSVEEYERESYFGQSFVVRYRSLLTFVKQSGQWRLVGAQDVTIPTEPPPLDVPGLVPGDYAGTYRYAPDRAWTVSVDHGVLSYTTRAGGPVKTLQPVAKDVFMGTDDERNLFVFQRDSHGKIETLIERRKFNDLRLDREH